MNPITYSITFFYTDMDGRGTAHNLILTGHSEDETLRQAVVFCKKHTPFVLKAMTGWAISRRDSVRFHIMPHHAGTLMDLLV